VVVDVTIDPSGKVAIWPSFHSLVLRDRVQRDWYLKTGLSTRTKDGNPIAVAGNCTFTWAVSVPRK